MIPWENYSTKDIVLVARIIGIARSNEPPSVTAGKLLDLVAEIRRTAISSRPSAPAPADGEALPVRSVDHIRPDREACNSVRFANERAAR